MSEDFDIVQFLESRQEKIDEMPWEMIQERLDKLWIPREAPHHSIIGQTRSGKSYLMRHGLVEPFCQGSKVCIIDVKGDDKTLAGLGRPVREIPKRNWRFWNDEPDSKWYRLIVDQDWGRARSQVAKAMEFINNDGDWVVVIDETRAITEPRPPGLNLSPLMEQLWLRGGSRGNCAIAATQGPRWVPRSMFDQPQFFWIGRVEDEDSHKRLREIGSVNKKNLPTIVGLKKHHWLYIDSQEDEKFARITKVTNGNSQSEE